MIRNAFFRIQDKGNRFTFADKKMDREKANEKIRKSNFKRIDLIRFYQIFKT